MISVLPLGLRPVTEEEQTARPVFATAAAILQVTASNRATEAVSVPSDATTHVLCTEHVAGRASVSANNIYSHKRHRWCLPACRSSASKVHALSPQTCMRYRCRW